MNIEAKELSKIYGSGESSVIALDKVNLEIASGDFISIMGPSGSGKSTLLRCINLLERPDEGEILYHGKDILKGTMDINHHRTKIGMVFQSFNLFNNKNVLDNCMIGQIKVLKRSKEEAMQKAMDDYLANKAE